MLRIFQTLAGWNRHITTRHAAYTVPSHSVKKNIGLAGAGQIGSVVAIHLLKAGHSVKIYDPCTTNADKLVQHGATWVDTPYESATSVDVFITAVPGPPQVRDVMEGENGAFQALKKGSCWIDHTTTDTNESKRMSRVAETQGVSMLEAPLTGGHELLKGGQMSVVVGGCPSVLASHIELMYTYATTILHMGPVGSASVVKVISNMLCAVHTVITSEALMLAKKHNVDLVNFFHGIRASAGNSFVFETEAPLIFNGSHDPGFTMGLHCKDLDLGHQLAKEKDVPLEVMGLVEQIYRRAMFKYGANAGSSHPAKLLQDDLNVSLQIDGFEEWTYSIEKVEGRGIGVVHKCKK